MVRRLAGALTLALLAAALPSCGERSSDSGGAGSSADGRARVNPPTEEPVFSPEFEKTAKERGYDPHAHRVVLRYFRKLWAGEARDAGFEAKTLSHDVGFRLLNLAELVVAMSDEIDLPIDNAVEFLSTGTAPDPLAEGVLTAEVARLRVTCTEEERALRLLGDPDTKDLAVAPLKPPVDRVEALVRFCSAMEMWCRPDGTSHFPKPAAQAK